MDSTRRTLAVMRAYPRATRAWAMRNLGALPGFSVEIFRGDTSAIKEQRKAAREPSGWAETDKTVILKAGPIRIGRATVREGQELTAEHFWLSRPTADIDQLLRLVSAANVRLPESGTLFEPGCGAGRYMYYLADRLGLRPTGADIYQPAIEVAEVANIHRNAKLVTTNLLSGPMLNGLADRHFDVLLSCSHIGHTSHLPGFRLYVDRLFQVSKTLLFVESAELTSLLIEHGARILHRSGKTVFAVRAAPPALNAVEALRRRAEAREPSDQQSTPARFPPNRPVQSPPPLSRS